MPINAEEPLPSRREARRYAFIGQVRPYKGVEELLEAFSAVPGTECQLLIAGEASPHDFGQRIAGLAAIDNRVDVRLGRLNDAEMATTTKAADIIVLPFRNYLHSGSIIYALSCGRAVLTPSTPFADGLAKIVGAGWVQTYRGSITPQDLVVSAPVWVPDLTSLTWTALGSAAKLLYITLRMSHDRQRVR